MVIGTVGFLLPSLPLLFLGAAADGRAFDAVRPGEVLDPPAGAEPEELVGGNGMVEMGTFVAILLGTITGGVMVAIHRIGPVSRASSPSPSRSPDGSSAAAIPMTPARPRRPRHQLESRHRNVEEPALRLRQPRLWLSMLGISWFWFYGATFLTQFPNFAKDILGGDEHVVTLLLALFSVGIGVGSLLCERLSGHKVEIGLVPFGSIGLTVFAFDLWLATRNRCTRPSSPASRSSCSSPGHLRVVADLMLIGMFGGFYIVPLYAMIQQRSDAAYRSRIIAANNILNAIFMVASAGLAIALLSPGCRSRISSLSPASSTRRSRSSSTSSCPSS